MNKRDKLLAEKCIKAKQVRIESKISKELISLDREKNFSPSKKSSSSKGVASSSIEPASPSIKPSTADENSDKLPQISSPQQRSSMKSGSNSNSGNNSGSSSYRGGQAGITEEEMQLLSVGGNTGKELVDELTKRSLVGKTKLRKLQATIKAQMNDKMKSNDFSDNNNTMSANDNGSGSAKKLESRTGSRQTSKKSFESMFDSTTSGMEEERDPYDENYFMPKVRKLRPDGASLYDIYLSKKDDVWGKIIKAQYIEDEENKVKKKLEKEKYNDEFGILLRQQIESNAARDNIDAIENERLAKIQDESAKKTADMQAFRVQDARDRHKQFINNAMEDIERKAKIREKKLVEEITSSTIMVNKAADAMKDDDIKKAQLKAYNKAYQDSVYQDNLIRQAKLLKEKHDDWEDTKKIIRTQEEMQEKEQARRDRENRIRLERSSEGPAHKVVEQIKILKSRNEDHLYHNLVAHGDKLNEQLLKSEVEGKERFRGLGQELQQDNLLVINAKKARAKDDEENSKRINAVMKQMLKDQEAQDIQEKLRKKKLADNYRNELNNQLDIVRSRSMASLTKTMTDEEMRYNSNLIKKYNKAIN